MTRPLANLREVFTGEGKLRKAFTFPLPRRDCIQATRLQVNTLYSTRIRNAVIFTANYALIITAKNSRVTSEIEHLTSLCFLI